MPRLTVILPARNAAATVKRAVASTLAGMPADAELVILNDGSTDDTRQILRSISDTRLRVIDGAGSGGVAQALAILLAATDSEFVARMDADDIGLPWRFATAMPAFDDGTDVVFSPVIELRGRRLVPGAPVRIIPEAFPLHLLLTNPVSHPTMIARRSAIDEVEGYRVVPSEDYDLWLRLAASGHRLRRVNTWGLLYRIHPTQITASADWRMMSWTSLEQAQAFADVSERTVGRRLVRLVQIPHLPEAERESALADFADAVGPAISRIPGPQGTFLARRLHRRLRWVDEQITGRDEPSAPRPVIVKEAHDE